MIETDNPARPPEGAVGRVDADAAAEFATAAGLLLLDERQHLGMGMPPDEVRKRGDRLSHELLAAKVAERFPDDALLSEEGVDDPARLRASRIWIVDPLDGTREYGEQGRSDWAVHVALVVNGELVAGAVALPELGVTWSSFACPDATSHSIPSAPRVVVSRTRKPEPVLSMAAALGAELVEMGSAGAKAMAVVRGDVDVYAHTGGQYEWDSAAPVAVARAAGLHVSRIDGSEPVYNQRNPWMPDLLICRPELAGDVLEVLAL